MKNSLLFLDIDGVLNGYDTKNRIGQICGIESNKVAILKEIVDILDCDIILSSSWRNYWTPDLKDDGVTNWKGRSPKRYGRYLNFKLGEYGLEAKDKTPDIFWARRGAEIWEYLNGKDVQRFAILDDEDFMWRKRGLDRNWISTYEPDAEWEFRYPGLQEKHIEIVRNKLLNGDFDR